MARDGNKLIYGSRFTANSTNISHINKDVGYEDNRCDAAHDLEWQMEGISNKSLKIPFGEFTGGDPGQISVDVLDPSFKEFTELRHRDFTEFEYDEDPRDYLPKMGGTKRRRRKVSYSPENYI